MTDKKRLSNQKNALKSTGPKTDEGKARSSMNALKHGLRSESLAVSVLESSEEWNRHRDHVLRDLSPVGYLESLMAERIASTLWRLGRVVRYETLSISSSMETAPEDRKRMESPGNGWNMSKEPLDLEKEKESLSWFEAIVSILEALPKAKDGEKVNPGTAWGLVELASDESGVDLLGEEDEEGMRLYLIDLSEMPDKSPVDEWPGWTMGYLRTVLSRVAELAKMEYEDLYSMTLESTRNMRDSSRDTVNKEEEALERLRRARLIPNEGTLGKISRYETTLERSLYKTLHELQRLQAKRAGGPLPPPAVLDVDVSLSDAS